MNMSLIVVLALCGRMQAQSAAAEAKGIPLPAGSNVFALMGVDIITFDFQREGLTPPRWGFAINSDGSGRYYEKEVPTEENPSGNDWQPVHVSPETMTVLLGGASLGEGKGCETRLKHIAKTGKKSLTYSRGPAQATCEFNYSDDPGVMKASDAFQAMAATMQFGARLKREHRFDRLGLDAEMQLLEDEAKAGRAIELQNILPVLQSIAEDERVIERVRRKAARMAADTTPATAK